MGGTIIYLHVHVRMSVNAEVVLRNRFVVILESNKLAGAYVLYLKPSSVRAVLSAPAENGRL
jgi:hypothetical protein